MSRSRSALALLAGALVLCSALAALAVAERVSTPRPRPPGAASGLSTFPAPPAGALVLAREHGADALAVAVRPGESGALVQASLVGRQGAGVSGARVRVGLGATTVPAAACGAGCYRASVPAPERPARAVVEVDGDAVAFPLPRRWPAADATALVARAARAWGALRTLAWRERLASDPAHAVETSYVAEAPDRLGYRVSGGAAAILIGDRRWDLSPGGRWQASTGAAVRQPAPYWRGVADARLLGSGRLRGRAVRRASFFDPQSLAWFEVAIDARTSDVLDLRMTATAHFMRTTYSRFNRPARLRPPRDAPPAPRTARGEGGGG